MDKLYRLTLHYLRFSAERERFYRMLFEVAPENEKGEIGATFLEDASVREWPLAGWLWDAIDEWKSRGDQIARRNLRALAGAVVRTLRGRPETMAWDLAERNRLRAKPVDAETKEVAARLYTWAEQYCRLMKEHWRRRGPQTRFEHLVDRIRHNLPGTPSAIMDFYTILNEFFSWPQIVKSEVTDTFGFLKRVCCPGGGRKPWGPDTGAKFIVRWVLGIPYRQIPKSAPIAHAR